MLFIPWKIRFLRYTVAGTLCHRIYIKKLHRISFIRQGNFSRADCDAWQGNYVDRSYQWAQESRRRDDTLESSSQARIREDARNRRDQ